MSEDVIAYQVLPRPPRLLQDGSGYDWREFDRWLQKIHSLIGMPQEGSKALNLINISQVTNNLLIEQGYNVPSDNSHDIKVLESRLEMIMNEMNMIIDNRDKISQLLQQIQNIQVSQSMGA